MKPDSPSAALSDAPFPFIRREYWRGSTVLLAEDDEIWRAVAAMMLRKNGFNVIEAADGDTALKAYHALGNTIDVVLADILMPGLNGIDLAKENFEGRYIPFVICTAVDDPFLAMDSLHHGVQDYLVKPVEEHRLINVVVGALARHRFYRETRDIPAFEGNLDRIFIKPRLDEVARAHTWVYAKIAPLGIANRDKVFLSALYEFLMNAYEHGCLGLGERRKAELLLSDGYAEELERLERQARGGRIEVCVSLLPDKVAITIEDDGPGFDFPGYLGIGGDGLAERLARPCGRGIAIASRYFDSVFYGNGGSRVTLVKRLGRPDNFTSGL